MKILIKLFIISFIVSLSSCVSTSVPKKVKKAQKKLSKHATGIKNILNVYPQLADSLRTTIHDTITLDSHTVDTSFIPFVDTTAIDAIMLEWMREDASAREGRTPRTNHQRVRYIRNKIIEEVLKDTTFFYEDSLVASTLIIRDGRFYTSTKVKKRAIPYVKEETIVNLDCETNKAAYKYWWFWIMFFIILTLVYLLRGKVR